MKYKVGGFVKIERGSEFFWCKILEVGSSKHLRVIVDNDLLCTDEHGLSLGDVISIPYHDILNYIPLEKGD